MNYKMKVELTAPDGQVIVTDKVIPMDTVASGKPAKRDMEAVKEWWGDNTIDLIVTTNNEPHHFMNCIMALAKYTSDWNNVKLTLLNTFDLKSDFTKKIIFESPVVDMLIHYIENVPFGIGCAVEETLGDWIVFIDQKVIVTEGWLDKIIATIRANKEAAMVAPWSSKRIRPMMGGNYIETAERIAKTSRLKNNEIALPGMFCLAVNRKVLEEVGGFLDKEYEPGYGAIADLYMRISRTGRTAVRADDCYVHDGTDGVSEAGEWLLNPAGYIRFMEKWREEAYDAYDTRAGRDKADNIVLAMKEHKTNRKKVVFVMREAPICGMVLAIIHICNELIEIGWDASFACTKLENVHKKLMPMHFEPYVFRDEHEMAVMLKDELSEAHVIATIWSTAKIVERICDDRDDLIPCYFIQDDERKFRHSSGELYSKPEDVEATYGMFQNTVVNSDWVLEEIEKLGHAGKKIGIGIDTIMFHPEENTSDRIRIMAHCRPSTPRRGWSFIAAVMNHLSKNENVEFITYDEEPEELYIQNHGHLGKVSPEQLAREMSVSHIFLEGSERQGWGMQALEAMASGCALVCTDNYGIHNFGTSGYDCVIVPYGDVAITVDVIERLIEDEKQRKALAKSARETAKHFSWNIIGNAWDEFLKGAR